MLHSNRPKIEPCGARAKISVKPLNDPFILVPWNLLHMFQLFPRFERTAPVLPVISEISRFEMILARMSDIYEFFKSITLSSNSM